LHPALPSPANLDRGDAERRLHAMAAALQEWLDRLNPEAVICHMVDEYVTHLLSLLAQRRGIPFIGYAIRSFRAISSSPAMRTEMHSMSEPRLPMKLRKLSQP